MNKETLIKELKKINIIISNNQIKQIDEFCLFLLEENQKYNLTAIRNYEEILLKHIYDSLTLVKAVDLRLYETLLDIGSGAGFPGIIIQMIFPNLKVTLLDSIGKKTHFLNLAKDKFNLKNLTVVNSRAEEFIKNNRETFDLITARAVASLNVLLELSIPFLKVNGLFIAMKADITKELEIAKEACYPLNSNIKSIIELTLPIENSKRTLVVVQKQKVTSLIYPRRYEQIIKKPLKRCSK